MGTSRFIRKWHRDLETNGFSPLPTQVVSNEEYLPLAPTPEQQRVATLIHDTARRNARRLGVSRRAFLASSAGMASAFLALNAVFGRFFAVDPVEAIESAAADERTLPDQFVFDIQTHHVAAPRQFPWLLGLRRTGRNWNRELQKDRGTMEDLYLENYIKEIFLDSDTAVAVISGIPSATDAGNILPPSKMAETRDVVNRLAASQRLVAHGLVAPNKGAGDLDEMRRQAADLKISAWKGYTGLPFGNPPRPWRVDDEKVAYPMLEESRRLGIKNICLHKGLPLQAGVEEYWHPRDLERAAKDFPDLNFIVYHSAFLSLQPALVAARDEFRTSSQVDWVTDLCKIRQRNPGLTNIYVELGSTFGMMVITSPLLCGHVLGMLVKTFGADHVLWGTDSIWWGSPQWQIEALRRYTMPETLMKQFAYQPLTSDVKAQILGGNAARVYGIDPTVHRNPVPSDFVSKLKAAYRDEGRRPSLTQYGWVLDG
ncbi:MAG TPA: amidohydrolase family protein [Candidatus Methylomirabilis sp.]|nr:amidohydrolase family protein [Candidatus Methylomirabilis sp.]